MNDIGEMRSWYRGALPERIKNLEVARDLLREGAAGVAEGIRRMAHNLAGSGAAYGFPKVSQAARAVETAREDDLPRSVDALLDTLRAVTQESETVHLLVVEEDTALSRNILAKLSGGGREVHLVQSAAQAERYLKEGEPALMVLDLMLPDMDGRRLLTRVKEQPHTACVPVIVIAAWMNESTREECFSLGAEVCLEKPLDLDALSRQVNERLRSASRTSSTRDAVTGLPRRVEFLKRYNRVKTLVGDTGEPLCVAVLELDTLEVLRASHGSESANEMLHWAAVAIERSVKASGSLARWEGNRLTALFPGLAAPAVTRLLESAQASLSGDRFFLLNGGAVRLSFSAGVAEVTEPLEGEEAVARALLALSQARRDGAGQIGCFRVDGGNARKKVLVAEDDELVAALIKHRLQREGFEVHHFTDGASAFLAAPSLAPDLMVLDVKMPEMDGFELLERLRSVAAFAKTPILMLTSMGGEPDVVRGLSLGADDYILKPFSPIELVARVHRHLRMT